MSKIIYECEPEIWCKKFDKEMIEKPNNNKIKQIYLYKEGKNKKERELIRNIEKILNDKKIKNYEELNKIINELELFKYKENVEFYFKKIKFSFEEKITIKECVIVVILFYFIENNEAKIDNEFLEYIKEFTNEFEYGKIKMKFPEFKCFDEDRKNCIATIDELLELGTKEDVLKEFFKDRVVEYCKEIEIDKINTLRKAVKGGNPEVKGIILLFIAPEDITLRTVTKAVEDVNFYVGAKGYTDIMYEVKLDKDCKSTKIKVAILS